MAEKFLLPCPCGRNIVVEPRLAGQMVPCECGTPVEVPTLMAMTKLPRAPVAEEEKQPAAEWEVGQSVHLIGWLILIVGISVAGYAIWARPASPVSKIDLLETKEGLDSWAVRATPAATLEVWHQVQAMGLYGIPKQVEKEYDATVFPYKVGIVVGLLATLLGMGLIVGSLVGRRIIQRKGARLGSPIS